jgi:NAD(P)-dependent dehydrogenase (short-subunit alcohol dehydrogenase family)
MQHYAAYPSLKGKVGFVTGGATGIGESVVTHFCHQGERTMDRMQSLAERVMPEDLARMVLFLAADDSRMCSAQEFIVDAGWA